eukprot:226661_1
MAQDNTNNNQDASNNIIQEGPPPVSFNSLKWRQIHPAGEGTLTRAPQHNILENVSLKFGDKWTYRVWAARSRKSKAFSTLSAKGLVQDIDSKLKSHQIGTIIKEYKEKLTWEYFVGDYNHS